MLGPGFGVTKGLELETKGCAWVRVCQCLRVKYHGITGPATSRHQLFSEGFTIFLVSLSATSPVSKQLTCPPLGCTVTLMPSP